MTITEFLSLPRITESVRQTGSGRWQSLCPAHNDRRTKSLSITAGDDGRILLNCKAGCQTEAVCRALGISLRDLFPSNNGHKNTTAQPPKQGPPRKAYSILEAAVEAGTKRIASRDGRPVRFVQEWAYNDRFKVLRFDYLDSPPDAKQEKTFMPAHHNGQGWVLADPPGPLPLYNLAELRARPDEPVYVHEGEKAADAGMSIGLLSITSAHGADSADKSDWKPLSGRDVLILPDNDPGGRQYAEKVRDILLDLNPPAKVRIVMLPGLAPKADIYDFIEQRDAVESEALRRQIEGMAERIKPEEQTNSTKYKGLILRVQREQMRAVRWLVTGHIAIGKVTILVGPPGAGKSLFTLWLVAAMHGVGRMPNLSDGTPVEIARGETLLVTAEDDPCDTLAPRLAVYDVDPASLAIYRGTQIIEPDGKECVGLFDLGNHLPAIDDFLIENPKTRLVLIDPVQTFLGQTDLNANTSINVALGGLAELAQRREIAAILVSHFNKKSDQAALDRIIGSRGFSGTVRAAWQVTADPEQKSRCILACTKQQNGPRPDAMAYRIRGVLMQIEGTMQNVPMIEFEPDRIDVDPDELVKPKSKKPRTDECAAWLKERLAAGAVLSSTVFEEGTGQGFSRNVCYAAKDRLRLKVSKDKSFQGQWFWELPKEEGDAQ